MNIKQLAELICQKEGKKIGVNIAQMNEILAVLSDITYQAMTYEMNAVIRSPITELLGVNGRRRAKKAKKCQPRGK